MRKISGFLFVFVLIFAIKAHAQQDTTATMPVVPEAPKQDSQMYFQYLKDSLKRAMITADSLKMGDDEKEFIKATIKSLCSKGMHGRGYVQ